MITDMLVYTGYVVGSVAALIVATLYIYIVAYALSSAFFSAKLAYMKNLISSGVRHRNGEE